MKQQANAMENIYKIDEKEFAKSISRKVIEILSHLETNNGDIEETRIEVISNDAKAEINSWLQRNVSIV